MELQLLENLGKIAGIGGISLGVFLLLFRDLLRKKIFPTLTNDQAFRLLRTVVLLTWSIALAGIGAWVWTETRSDEGPSATVNGSGIANTGTIEINGDVTVEPRFSAPTGD